MDNLFHDNMLWPTLVVLPKRTGWSLWGDAPELHPERVAKAAKQAVARVVALATWNPAG